MSPIYNSNDALETSCRDQSSEYLLMPGSPIHGKED